MTHHLESKTPGSIKDHVMEAIRAHRVEPRPRWHFVLLSLAGALGVLILVVSLLYVASLCLFILREHGLVVMPSFGWRGMTALSHSLPWLVLGFFLVLGVLVGSFIRRFAALHRRPLLVSVFAVLVLALLAGFLLAKTSVHRRLADGARAGNLPRALSMWYREPFRTKRSPDSYLGTIVATVPDGFLARMEDGERFVHIIITRRTMLPDGGEFSIGERFMAIGDIVATDTLQAFGVRLMDSDW